MTREQIRQKFINEWETHIKETPTQEMIDIVLNTDLSERHKSIEVDFEGTFVRVSMDKPWGARVLKTIYGCASETEKLLENFNPAKILSIVDNKGKRRIDYLNKEEINELLQIFTLKYEIWDAIDNAEELTIEELINMEDIGEELRALCLANNPSLDLTKLLNKVDSFVSNTKNYKNEPIVYDLFKGKLLETDVTYVRTYDASTDRMFFLAVNNNITSAKDAPASLIRIPKDLLGHLDKIRRQGEKYTCTWKNIDINSDDFESKFQSELVSLDGETYFDKLVYEA